MKESNITPILVDDAIFDGGWAVIKKLAQNKANLSVKKLDKNTGNVSDFDDSNPRRNHAFILENDGIGFYTDYTKYGMGKAYYYLFDGELL
jgi:hypothetical protein